VVSRSNSTVVVVADNITVGDVAIINITVIDGATGNVTIKIGDEYEQTVGIVDGVISVNVPGLTVGTKTVTVLYNGDAKFMPIGNSTEFNVAKTNAGIIIAVQNITYGEDEIITVFVNATGNVTIIIPGAGSETINITDGKATYSLPLDAGNYTVEVIYNGDVNTNSTSAKADFTVAKATPVVDVAVTDIVYGQDENIIVDVNADGTVTVKVNGGIIAENVTLVGGKVEIPVSALGAGKYEVEVIYNGNENYNVKTVTAVFNVFKANTTVNVEVEHSIGVGESQVINITVDNVNATGNAIICVDGVNYTATITNGKGNYTIGSDLAAGNHTVTVIYEGDRNLTGSWTSDTFEVTKRNVAFTILADDIVAGHHTTVKVSGLPDNATGYVIAVIDGTEYAINITSTKEVSVRINKAGTYNVTATYLGDDYYASSTANTSFNVTKESGKVDVEINDPVAGGDLVVKVTVPDDANGTINVTVDNQTVSVPVHGGENTIVISNMTEGVHNITTVYSGDDKYDSKTVVKVINVTTSIRAEDELTRGWNSPYDFEAEFLDKEGHVLVDTEVKFVVDGQTYTVKTDDKGIARLNESKLDLGTYNITCINPVTGQEVTKQVTIVKRLIENKDVTMDYSDGTKYVVRVIGDDGNPVGAGEYVGIKVNGVVYAIKTDSKGYARLPLNLVPGKYSISTEYKNSKVKNKITVKQILKLVKKTVKVKKGKKLKLKAKLKSSKGKPIKGKKITFKFKGKKYKAKTNKKGIAKVTIKKKVTKKLKKGKKYKFTATYISDTVKGKVKVKK
jgi:hypothetical protein